MGIYKITGLVTGVNNTEIFPDISNALINNIPISECAFQTVYCYAEDSNNSNPHGYADGMMSVQFTPNLNNSGITWRLKYKKGFECIPVPEFGYQQSNFVYEKNTEEQYIDSDNHIIELKDQFKEDIKFRDVISYRGEEYPIQWNNSSEQHPENPTPGDNQIA